ncbi:MAG: methyltransferase domain-containing protein [Candidatus Lokiarchaeota archaeon]|nr:methyltransferase domain-containing protein [Candidatus Lokiarchaeota archaeon]
MNNFKIFILYLVLTAISQSKSYRWIYDLILSKVYDIALKFGLTPEGEKILRVSVYDQIKKLVRHNDKLLDLCCGTGTLTVLLSNLLYKDCRIIGADISKGQISMAKRKVKNNNIQFIVMDANNLKYKDDYFDFVIISAALHEMNKEQRINVLKEVYRILKKSGYLLIFDHHEPKKLIQRIFYNFYLGFWEKIFSKSFEMQRNIIKELKFVGFQLIRQTPVSEFRNCFQNILSEKKDDEREKNYKL